MGKPFFYMELKTNKRLLERLQMLPRVAKNNVREKIRTELVPMLEQRAIDLSMDMPLPSSPFAFGTPRSKRYYFWMIDNDSSLTDGYHWIRTFAIESGWQFTAIDRVQQIQIRGRNAAQDHQYVFGPWAVQGHINTGWVAKAEEIRAELQATMRRELKRMWSEAVREALKGSG